MTSIDVLGRALNHLEIMLVFGYFLSITVPYQVASVSSLIDIPWFLLISAEVMDPLILIKTRNHDNDSISVLPIGVSLFLLN